MPGIIHLIQDGWKPPDNAPERDYAKEQGEAIRAKIGDDLWWFLVQLSWLREMGYQSIREKNETSRSTLD